MLCAPGSYTPMGAHRFMQFTLRAMQDNAQHMDSVLQARKMHYTDTKGTVKHLFHRWQQKGKAHLNRQNTDNPMKPHP